MSQQADSAYYWHRAAEELEHGDKAADTAIAAVHYELAYRYGALATRTGTLIPELRLVYSADHQLAA